MGLLLSEFFPYVFDRNLSVRAGWEIFQFEWAVLNTPEPRHFMLQRFKQPSDFTVFPLDQDHFQM